jgi:cellulase/cellobiase CelA1
MKWNKILGALGLLFCGTLALDNPFENKPWAKNPLFAQTLKDAGLDDHPAAKFAITQPSVVWMDAIERIQNLPLYLNSTGDETVFLMVYDLPFRDCSASASSGQLQCHTDNCEDGLTKYKDDFILPIRDILKEHPQKTKILFIETDSLPNSVTNYMNPNGSPCQTVNPPKCSNTAMTAYYNGIIWALNELYVDDNTYFYLDHAGSGWLGWAGQQQLDDQKRPTDYPDQEAQGLLQLFIHNVRQLFESVPDTKELSLKSSLNNAITEYNVPLLQGGLKPNVVKRIRGFATNIANRSPLLRREDVCDMASQYNFCLDELGFIDLADHLWKESGYEWGWVVDTGRNGGDEREGQSCDQWCNIKSKYNPEALPQIPDEKWLKETGYVFDTENGVYMDNGARLDAFFWLKDCSSDGVSKKGAKRFDCMCVRDIAKGFQFADAPEAGTPFLEMLSYWYP